MKNKVCYLIKKDGDTFKIDQAEILKKNTNTCTVRINSLEFMCHKSFVFDEKDTAIKVAHVLISDTELLSDLNSLRLMSRDQLLSKFEFLYKNEAHSLIKNNTKIIS